jgi:hypothetical protein
MEFALPLRQKKKIINIYAEHEIRIYQKPASQRAAKV